MIYAKSNWDPQQIQYHKIKKGELLVNPILFYAVTAASFLESTVSLYTANLIEYFKGDHDVTDWLKELWEPEELSHGFATKQYVLHAWPEYHWQKAYDSFYSEYSAYCKVELLRQSRALEMLARCVTETGSATMYRAISNCTTEPILRDLMDKMSKDEVKHYSNFYYTLLSYDRSECNGFLSKARVITDRYKVASQEDVGIALKHIYSGWEEVEAFSLQGPRQVLRTLQTLTKEYFPYQMAKNMLSRALGADSFWKKAVFGFMQNKIKRELKLIA